MLNKKQLQEFRNKVISHINFNDRKRNVIRLNTHNSYQHELIKFRICFELQKKEEHYLTEARLIGEKGTPDIINMNRAQIIEIMVSEKPESIEWKSRKYPKNFEIIAVKSFEDYINENYEIIR